MKNTIKNNWLSNQTTSRNDNDNLFKGIYIPFDFRFHVLKHLILNYSGNINDIKPALFLAIQGYRGEGKTFMLQELCNYYDIDVEFISGSDLCGPLEKDSVTAIQERYESACIHASISNRLHLIVIDDFHLSIASDNGENVSKTSNSQVLLSYLMNLADDPFIHKVRVPIILLGNNFKNIYSALIRNGRMDFYSWKPSVDDKVNIVYHTFCKLYPAITISDVKRLINEYPEKYIAFFSNVIQDCLFSEFKLVVDEFERKKGNFKLDEISLLVKNSLRADKNIDINTILDFAKKRDLNKEESFEDIQIQGQRL